MVQCDKEHLDEIADVRTRVAHRAATEPYLTPGQPVEITDGPFAQLAGIFLANDGDEGVVLLLRYSPIRTKVDKGKRQGGQCLHGRC
jgi:hypothetical protein